MGIERLKGNFEGVRSRIDAAARRSGRDAGSVRLVGVTKRHPTDVVRPLVELGLVDLGENYPQELWRKADELADPAIRWHLIGHLQGNKVKRTWPIVSVIHGVDSLKLLESLDAMAADAAHPPSACLQVNVSGEDSKHGWSAAGLLADADRIAACKHLPIVGLMTIAGYGTTDAEARPTFAALRELRDRLVERTGLPLPELSMGMSTDFEAAIEEGATVVRVGSALFEGVTP